MFKRNPKALRCLVLIALLTFGYGLGLLTPTPSWGGTVLGDLAASMQPGTWSKLTGTNAGLLSSQWTSGGHGYDDGNMAWNSKKRILMHTSADHGPYMNCSSFPNPPGNCWKAIRTYTDSTNTWAVGGAIPPRVTGCHGYDHVAWDDDNEVMYIHEYYSRRVTATASTIRRLGVRGNKAHGRLYPRYPIMRQSARWLIIPLSTAELSYSMVVMPG